MAFSSSEGKLFFRDWLTRMFLENQVRTILDVGAGAGVYGIAAKEAFHEAQAIYMKYNYVDLPHKGIIIHAVEIFRPYIERFGLNGIYDIIHVCPVAEIAERGANYDLVIFGDVLEHMVKEEALKVWYSFKQNSRFVYLSLPCKIEGKAWSQGYEQELSEGDENKCELHLHDWKYDEILNELGPFLWQVPLPTVVTMIAEGNLK